MMFTVLLLGSGLCWTVTYLLIIRQGFRDRTYGMPVAAACANISWEFIFSFVHAPSPIQHGVNVVWFTLDVLIFGQLLWYGPREFADLPRRVFYAGVGLALATSFPLVLLISADLDNWAGAYAAFGQNLMMSALFVAMLYRRASLRGQSLGIAVGKLAGTGLASLAFYLYSTLSHHSPLLQFLYVAILVYDLLYVALVVRMRRHPTQTPGQPRAMAVAGGARR
jgi:hypothetical protein